MKGNRTVTKHILGRVNVDDYVTAKKAAEMLNITVFHLYDIERRFGLLPYYFGGSTFRVYLRSQVEAIATTRAAIGKNRHNFPHKTKP